MEPSLERYYKSKITEKIKEGDTYEKIKNSAIFNNIRDEDFEKIYLSVVPEGKKVAINQANNENKLIAISSLLPTDKTSDIMTDISYYKNLREQSPVEFAKLLYQEKEIFSNSELCSKIDLMLINKFEISHSNLQRYYRINFLTSKLQHALSNKKFSLKVAENLSFLNKNEQMYISQLLESKNIKLSEDVSLKLKKFSKYGELNNKKIKEIILASSPLRFTITFNIAETQELSPYLKSINIQDVKKTIIQLIKDSYEK